MIQNILEKLKDKKDLLAEEMETAVQSIMTGEVKDVDIETFLKGRISIGGRLGPSHLACKSYEKWKRMFNETNAEARNGDGIAAPPAGASLADSRVEPVDCNASTRER